MTMDKLMLYSSEAFLRDLTKTPSHCALTGAFCLIVLFYIYLFLANPRPGRIRINLHGLVIIAIGLLEIYAAIYSEDYSHGSWILDSFGNFCFGAGLLFVVVGMMVYQHLMIFESLRLFSECGRFNHHYEWGFYGIIVAAVLAIIVSLVNTEYIVFVTFALIAFELWVISYSIYSAIVCRGRLFEAIFSTIVYLVGVGGLICLFSHFIIPMIILFIVVICGGSKSIRGNGSSRVVLEDGTELYGGNDTKRDYYGNTWERDKMRSDIFHKR